MACEPERVDLLKDTLVVCGAVSVLRKNFAGVAWYCNGI